MASLISTRPTTELVEASNKAITNLTDRSPITNDGDNNHHSPTCECYGRRSAIRCITQGFSL
ncbi:hypothetical protein [Rhizobium aouanii]|uniref:Uncharacterized protein n=1 Tax=Rhizobium aouanii TaxID=3118145 RepID=A0ABU8CM92_9HYPH